MPLGGVSVIVTPDHLIGAARTAHDSSGGSLAYCSVFTKDTRSAADGVIGTLISHANVI